MQITIQLVGIFRIGRFKEAIREYPSATTVSDLIEELQLPVHLLGTVLINDRHVGVENLLCDGDTVSLLPLLDGG